MINIIKKYYKSMIEFNKLLNDVEFHQLHDKDNFYKTIDFVEESIDLDLKQSLIDAEYYKIDNILFKKIIRQLLILRYKFNFMYSYKQKELAKAIESNEVLKLKSQSLYTEIDEKVDNIIRSKIVTTSGQYEPVTSNIVYTEGFNITGSGIEPIFLESRQLDFRTYTDNSSKINLQLDEQTYVSKINLMFDRDIKDNIVVSYKHDIGGEIVFTSETISLSRNKTISLKFDNCSEIVLFSNANIFDSLININLYGGNNILDRTSCVGILQLEGNYSEILIDTVEDISYYKVNSTLPLNNLLTMDISNNPDFEYIYTNSFSNLEYNNGDKIVFIFNTENPLIQLPKIYGTTREVI